MSASSSRLPALDGVRALAVTGVLAAHAGIPGLAGGFIGVDMFFVLSGFLITSLLLAERRDTGSINLPAFLARRARRLLPAALVMIVTVVAAAPLLPVDAVSSLRADAMRACLWSSNWQWALQGTDYFGQGGTASPLQHTWSLAVEEQFYLVWPCLLLVLWRGLRHAHTLRRRLIVVAGSIALASWVECVLLSASPEGRVYFGSDTRAQELAVGACLAALLSPTWSWAGRRHRGRRSPQRLARRPAPVALSIVGLLGLVILAHRAGSNSDETLVMPAASLLSAALIGGVMLDGRQGVARLLSAVPLRVLGRLSYSIYLWHWPIFEVFDGARTGLDGLRLAALRLLVTLVAATASYRLIEKPTRRLALPNRRTLLAAAGAVGAALTFAACSAQAGAPAVSSPVASGTGLDAPPPLTTSAPVSPTPSPSVTTGHTAVHKVDVFGDSIAWTLVHYLPATPGVQFVDRTVLGCGIVRGGPFRYFGQQYADRVSCDGWGTRWPQQVRADHPDEVLLIVGRWETMDRVYQGRWTHVGDPQFDDYLAGLLGTAISDLGSSGARVVVTTEPYNRRGEQPDGSLYPEDEPARVTAWNKIVDGVLAAHPQAVKLDLNKKLCPSGAFTWTVAGVQVRSDGVHLTPDGVRWLTPWLLRGLGAA